MPATKDPCRLKGARALRVTARRHRKVTASPRESRRKCVQERGERTCRARRQTNSVPDGELTVASRAVSLQPTSDRRQVAPGKSGVLRSSCLRIDPIEISFKPQPHRPRRVTSRSRRPVPLNYPRTTKTSSDERQPLAMVKYTRDVQTCSPRCVAINEFKENDEGDNLIPAKEKINSNCSISTPASFGPLIRWHRVSDRSSRMTLAEQSW